MKRQKAWKRRFFFFSSKEKRIDRKHDPKNYFNPIH
jgi:hypothetical protein